MNKFFNYLLTCCLLIASVNITFAQNSGVIAGQDTSRRVITTAVPFLLITPDARSGAMGDAGGAISPDANSIHWNNAKLAFIESDIGFSINYTPWLNKIVNDMYIFYGSGYYKIDDNQAIGLSLRWFDLGEIQLRDQTGQSLGDFTPNEFAIDGTYSRKLSEKLGIGVTARFIHSNLSGNISNTVTGDSKPGNSVAADIGVYYNTDIAGANNSNLALGAHISNIGRKISYNNSNNKDFIPTNLRLSSAYTTHLDPYNTLTFALDLNKLMVPTTPVYEFEEDGSIKVDANGDPVIRRGKDPDRPLLSGMFGSFTDAPDGFSEEIKEVMIATGVEYWYNQLFAARLGYFYENQDKGNRRYFTVGVGFRYQVFGVDFAYLVPQDENNPLAETLRFTLHFNFDQSLTTSTEPIN